MVLKTMVAIKIFLSVCALIFFSAFLRSALASEDQGGAAAIRREVEQDALEQAIRAFQAGQYRQAKISFEILSESAVSPAIGRTALFALASVKLVLAQTPEEFADAVAVWERWSSQIKTEIGGEDPRMVTPFLLRLDPGLKQQAAPRCEPLPKSQKGSTVVKGMLQNKAREMESLRTKLELREREVRRLRHQLESLEEIHRKYQEKKQEASAP